MALINTDHLFYSRLRIFGHTNVATGRLPLLLFILLGGRGAKLPQGDAAFAAAATTAASMIGGAAAAAAAGATKTTEQMFECAFETRREEEIQEDVYGRVDAQEEDGNRTENVLRKYLNRRL